jgi:hypothetical protein
LFVSVSGVISAASVSVDNFVFIQVRYSLKSSIKLIDQTLQHKIL